MKRKGSRNLTLSIAMTPKILVTKWMKEPLPTIRILSQSSLLTKNALKFFKGVRNPPLCTRREETKRLHWMILLLRKLLDKDLSGKSTWLFIIRLAMYMQ